MRTFKVPELKLAAISGRFSDKEVKTICLNTKVGSESDISEIINIIWEYRPKIFRRFIKKLRRAG